ncbi:MAG TPA: acetyl/propionyl-CoA carboxylase subunit alpha, partial [Thermoanaerobaculia bacterium]|nr:acetyl/propionyl-CoA carboxylase subunit alpha [Thermoanaerobaculia bacterium]
KDREEARTRLLRALRECRVEGIETTVPFFVSLLLDPRVVAGDVSTQFLDSWTYTPAERSAEDVEGLALVAAAVDAMRGARAARPDAGSSSPSRWRTVNPTHARRA